MDELSLIFVTSCMYCFTAWLGRAVLKEERTTIPKGQLILLGLSSMGSTYTSVRSLRYVIYPVQVLGKSCKPIPVMLMGLLMGKRYPFKTFVSVIVIVAGVVLFIGKGGKGGDGTQKEAISKSVWDTLLGLGLLFISLCFDGGTAAYEEKLMAVHHVEAFDLMFHIQFAKLLLSGILILVTGQIIDFVEMINSTGVMLLLLGLAGAAGQVFIFVSIAKFGALVTTIMGLARKILTLVASIVIYGHEVNFTQGCGLVLAVTAMIHNFYRGNRGSNSSENPESIETIVEGYRESDNIELSALASFEEKNLLQPENFLPDLHGEETTPPPTPSFLPTMAASFEEKNLLQPENDLPDLHGEETTPSFLPAMADLRVPTGEIH